METLLEIYKRLKVLEYTLDLFKHEDENDLYAIFKEVVDAGTQFPYESNSIEEFHRQFFSPKSQVYVCHDALNKVVGGFYLRPNYSGRSSHIANAAYMIRNEFRGKGIGKLLVIASLHLAKELGFHSIQFNMVFSQNTIAINLYLKLGFQIISTIPKAIKNPDGTYQDGFVMFRELDDL